ncbi:hypothetical protein QP228_008075 [Pseudoglutamicibacter cumminsii]|uniref:hypothetical protein n=1 Tax=Pseudoglutamicibacter cumminsii TaxID=156979 RepID=UPI00255595B7|nr:hypothetical protein [Pseudoglutamicibacter cumminsii]MDZ3745928.1 hypothetical protein [Pseudoglutamicibacter cumminsii]
MTDSVLSGKHWSKLTAVKAVVSVTLAASLGLAGCGSSSSGFLDDAESSPASASTSSEEPISAPEESEDASPETVVDETSDEDDASEDVEGEEAERREAERAEAEERREERRIIAMKKQALKSYKRVLSNPQDFTKNAKSSPLLASHARKYYYAMTDVNNDGIPEMLLSKSFWELSPVVIVSLNDKGEPRVSKSYILDGDTDLGSTRFLTEVSTEGDGVYELRTTPDGLQWERRHYRLEGDKLVKVDTEYIDIGYGVSGESTSPDWRQTSDASSLEHAIHEAVPVE